MMPFAPDAHNAADTTNFGLTAGQSVLAQMGQWKHAPLAPAMRDSLLPEIHPPSMDLWISAKETAMQCPHRDRIWRTIRTPIVISILTRDRRFAGGSSRQPRLFHLRCAQYPSADRTPTTPQPPTRPTLRRVPAMAAESSQWRSAGAWSGNGNNAHTTIVGFANFFLGPTYSGTSGPICASYIGPASVNGNGSGGTDGTKIYSTMLYQ